MNVCVVCLLLVVRLYLHMFYTNGFGESMLTKTYKKWVKQICEVQDTPIFSDIFRPFRVQMTFLFNTRVFIYLKMLSKSLSSHLGDECLYNNSIKAEMNYFNSLVCRFQTQLYSIFVY